MSKLKVLDLFSGIGGFSLGLERTGGFETVAFCEIEDFPRKVLAKHWPEVPQYEDVRQLTGDILKRDGISVDVITGGFPCQDISTAGNQEGLGPGTRSGLWSEIDRLIGELRPKYVILENVANLLRGPSKQPGEWFGKILSDLAECGMHAEWENIPAATVGAPHRRERVWIVAYPASERCGEKGESIKRSSIGLTCTSSASSYVSNANSERSSQQGKPIKRLCGTAEAIGETDITFDAMGRGIKPTIRRGDNGFSERVDRLKGLGNAVVPQIPELIGNAILAAESNAA
jgi:DNA (cytosine-5)-methyltransferase 1